MVVALPLRALGRDHFGIHPRPVEGAAVAGVFHLDALIHNSDQPRFQRTIRGREIDDPKL
jgi:hypothetical protein